VPQLDRELSNDSNPEVITLMSEEEREREHRRLAEIVRLATQPDNRTIEEIDKERAQRKQEETLQRVGAALLRTIRRLS
jgi:hypothetical protein